MLKSKSGLLIVASGAAIAVLVVYTNSSLVGNYTLCVPLGGLVPESPREWGRLKPVPYAWLAGFVVDTSLLIHVVDRTYVSALVQKCLHRS